MITSHTRNAVSVCPALIPSLVPILRRTGFAEPFFQEWRVGQRFGLSKPLTYLLDWHVRGFADGTLDSEVEISRGLLQHLAGRPGSYYSPLLRILRSHHIPFRVRGGVPLDATHVYLPELFGQSISIHIPRLG